MPKSVTKKQSKNTKAYVPLTMQEKLLLESIVERSHKLYPIKDLQTYIDSIRPVVCLTTNAFNGAMK